MHALINRERSDREAGFTLIELLVVVAIIGILAAIAIPVFLNQRASARDASVKADLNGIAKVMETVYADSGEYPSALADLQANNAVTSPGNVITIQSNPSDFQIQGCNVESGTAFFYDSSAGGLLADTRDEACGADDGEQGAPNDPAFATVSLPSSTPAP